MMELLHRHELSWSKCREAGQRLSPCTRLLVARGERVIGGLSVSELQASPTYFQHDGYEDKGIPHATLMNKTRSKTFGKRS